jgi:hypothetical protein
MILSINNSQNNYALHYAECLILFIVMLIVIMLNVFMLSVLMLNVVMLSVVAPARFVNLLFCQTINKGKYDLPNPNLKDHPPNSFLHLTYILFPIHE